MVAIKSCIRFILVSVLSLIGCQSAFAQEGTINHWESVIYANDTWHYFVGISEPSSDWKTVAFDDTNWLKGTGGIGYSDGDDNTVIDPCISLYMRIKFTIYDLSKIERAILHVDYDDSFVAYLNNVEVARANVSGNPPAYNQLADGNHEAQVPGGGNPTAFMIEKNDLLNCLQENENVLALQIHNVDANSSDMSSTTYFSVAINDDSHQYREIPGWFAAPFDFSSSDIPIMVIDMEGRQIVDEPKTMGRMGIINNGEGQRNTLGDTFNEYDGWIGIEYRGNASMGISDKKPFTFETRHEDGADTNVVLLGLPRENDFILRAAYIDKTLMRDALAYHMSRKIGHWAPRTRHVELVLNGNYEGTYVLVEKIKPDDDRLDIVRMDTSDISGEAVTGGYIWSVQQPDGNDVVFLSDQSEGNSRVLKYPKPDEVTPEQFDYIRQYEESFRIVMRSPDYNDPATGYPAYIEPSTFIEEIIVQEATSNSDAYGWSSYFYKDRNKKMCSGPAWDFDQGLCNSTYNDGDQIGEFIIEKPDGARPFFWDVLWEDSDFKLELKKKWNAYRQGPLKTDALFAYIDSVANYLNEAQQHNFSRWPILGQEVWRSLPGAADRDTYQKEVDYMKNWLSAHLTWMDQQLYYVDTAVYNSPSPTPTDFILQQNYPNPFNPATTITYQLPKSTNVELSIYNLAGQKLKVFVSENQQVGKHQVQWDATGYPSGIYYYMITAGDFSQVKKMVLVR